MHKKLEEFNDYPSHYFTFKKCDKWYRTIIKLTQFQQNKLAQDRQSSVHPHELNIIYKLLPTGSLYIIVALTYDKIEVIKHFLLLQNHKLVWQNMLQSLAWFLVHSSAVSHV